MSDYCQIITPEVARSDFALEPDSGRMVVTLYDGDGDRVGTLIFPVGELGWLKLIRLGAQRFLPDANNAGARFAAAALEGIIDGTDQLVGRQLPL